MTDTARAAAFAARQQPRIFCIGRNYAEHIAELGNALAGEQAIVFMKPLSALVAPEEPIELPTDRGAVHYEAEVVVEIGAAASALGPGEARAHIRALGLGLDLTLRDRQTGLKASGEPWERAKAFDASAPLGPLTPITEPLALDALEFTLDIDDERRQTGNTGTMLVAIDELIAALSRDWWLRPGDLIYTGTPAGIGPLAPGMSLTLASPQLVGASWRVV